MRIFICLLMCLSSFAQDQLQLKGKVDQIIVRHPAPFQGPIRPGGLLPKGMVSLEIIVNSKRPHEYRVVRIPQTQPLVFVEMDYMPSRPKMKNPAGLVIRPGRGQTLMGLSGDSAEPSSRPSHVVHDLPAMPGYILMGVGVASFITGGIIHFGNFDDTDLAAGKTRSINWSLISGATFLTLGGGWIAFTW